MSLFERYLRAEESLFRNQIALDSEFLPDRLLHREGQIKEIANCIGPILKGNKPKNVFIHGPTGVGKTAVIKYLLLKELPQVSAKTKSIYLNCWNQNTRFNILKSILNKFGIIAPGGSVSSAELYQRLENLLKTKNLILGLDEVDQLSPKYGHEVLYDLLRIEGMVGLILISNDPYALAYLDQRIRSSLNVEEIEFKPYKRQEVFEILKSRSEMAFFPRVITEDQIRRISNFVFDYGGDIRIGLYALKEAGMLAEQEALRKIEDKHVEEALGKIKRNRLIEKVNKLKKEKSRVYEVLKAVASLTVKEEKIHTGKIQIWFKERRSTISRRTLRYAIKELEELGMIESEIKQLKRGRTQLIKLKIPTDAVISY